MQFCKMLTMFLFWNLGTAWSFSSQEKFIEALNVIKENAGIELSNEEFYKAAISGVLNKIDIHMGYKEEAVNLILSSEREANLKQELKGNIVGIGASLRFDKERGDRFPVVLKTFEKSGAEKAGLKEGDQILKIDNTKASEFKSFSSLIDKIRGNEGSSVDLQILTDGEVKNVKVKRSKIEWNSIEVVEKSNHFAILKINYFNEKSKEHLTELCKKFQKEKIASLVIDLRHSSGGLFSAGMDSLHLFLDKGLKSLKMKTNKGETNYEALENGICHQFKLAVLVDHETRSMAEAFGASLKFHKKAILVGERTFGKASVETIINLDENFAAKLTTAFLHLPNDATWRGVGVLPDFEFPQIVQNSKGDGTIEFAKTLLKVSI